MSEGVPLSSDSSIDPSPQADAASPPASSRDGALVAQAVEPSITSAAVPTVPATAPADAPAILEILIRGLGPDADESARAAARELCAQAAQSLAAAAPVARAASVPPAPSKLPAPTMPVAPLPTSPITMAAHALRQLPPDQLLDLLLQRLRAALPVGASVSTPKGIQFQLVPMTRPPGSR